jgi:hypothetical protein
MKLIPSINWSKEAQHLARIVQRPPQPYSIAHLGQAALVGEAGHPAMEQAQRIAEEVGHPVLGKASHNGTLVVLIADDPEEAQFYLSRAAAVEGLGDPNRPGYPRAYAAAMYPKDAITVHVKKL